MSTKKLGVWVGGIIGLFAVLLLLMYFIYPYISPAKAARVEKEQQSKVETPSFGYEETRSPSPDSLSRKVIRQKTKIDSLTMLIQNKSHIIDSLKQAMHDKQGVNAAVKESDSAAAEVVSQLLLPSDGTALDIPDPKKGINILVKELS